MIEGQDKLSKRYRDLAREEPPAALDAAILAASRRAVSKPSFSRRWGAPVSIAAVLVLAFGLSLEMQHEKPDVATSPPETAAKTAVSAPVPSPPPASSAAQAAEAVPAQNAPVPAPRAEKARAPSSAAKPEPFQATPARPAQEQERKAAPLAKESAAAVAMPAAPAPARAPSADYNVAPSAGAPASRMTGAIQLKSRVMAPQEEELEKIAKLRAEGRDADADRELEAFERKYPGYRIDDAMWARVKPR
jgi:resuscitation-promoting factor RpfA